MSSDRPVPTPRERRGIWTEIWILLALSLGRSGVYAIVNLIGRLTEDAALTEQIATLNPTRSPRIYLDLTYQILAIGFGLAPVALALFFLATRQKTPSNNWRKAIGLDRFRLSDLGWGIALCFGIGIPGLLFYMFGRAVGITVQVQASALNTYWWTVPILMLSAFQNGALEEIIVVAYLYERTKDAGWNLRSPVVDDPVLEPVETTDSPHPRFDWRFIAFSAILRGSYHLYQGIGPFFGNAIMGIVFALWYQSRWGKHRVLPLIIAHTLIDAIVFVGYQLLPAAWLIRLGFAA